MAGIPLPQMNIGAPPPQVVTAKKSEIAGEEAGTAYKVGAGLRDVIGKGADAMSDFGNTNLNAVKLVAGAAATPVGNFGKGLFGMSSTPTADPTAAAPTAVTPSQVPAPAANPASKVTMDPTAFQVPDSGTIGGGAEPAPTPVAPVASPEQYPTAPPQNISQYLPQLMAAAASRDAPPAIATPGQTPFRTGGTWDDFFNDRRTNALNREANAANVASFNAATQRRTADTGVLNALVEPVKADAANQTQLATTGMTANTSRATNEATNAARMKEVELTAKTGLEGRKAMAEARRYAADKSVESKGSAPHYATTTDGSVVMSQLNKNGQVATHVIDPKRALLDQQADAAVMAAPDGGEVIIPGGKGVVKIVNGTRKVYNKKTGELVPWSPSVPFSAVGGMPPARNGELENFLDQ